MQPRTKRSKPAPRTTAGTRRRPGSELVTSRRRSRPTAAHKRSTRPQHRGARGGDADSSRSLALISGLIPRNRYLSAEDTQAILAGIESKLNLCEYQDQTKLFAWIQRSLRLSEPEFRFYMKGAYRQEFPILKQYFDRLQTYADRDYRLYSLGDSLDKFNHFWNIKHDTSPVIAVPFSGSMFTESLVRIDTKRDRMFNALETMRNNNPAFDQMIESLNAGDNVLITDYINTGKSFFTILELLRRCGAPTGNLRFLYVTYNDEISVDQFRERSAAEYDYSSSIDLLEVTETAILSRYFTNSEDSNSRCVAKYPVDIWDQPVEAVYRDGLAPNYHRCNLHRLMFMCAFTCFFQKA